ncbi:MAG: NAD(P)-dependent dehydrogenase (short-subunit alcohol dehydrogenase family) [Acidimicrobiales bacterium]|jgi:NAD(P)-dependent dehydrogenase (short-subunit alcohol dehydrogenase family)
MRLNGKVAIVTGAGQAAGDGTGNGRATALAFAREGATVVLANRSLPSPEETQQLIQAEGFEAETVVTDNSVEADCKALIDRVVDQHGRVDVLHNNVGVGTADGDTTAIELDNWRTTLDVNVGQLPRRRPIAG